MQLTVLAFNCGLPPDTLQAHLGVHGVDSVAEAVEAVVRVRTHDHMSWSCSVDVRMGNLL